MGDTSINRKLPNSNTFTQHTGGAAKVSAVNYGEAWVVTNTGEIWHFLEGNTPEWIWVAGVNTGADIGVA